MLLTVNEDGAPGAAATTQTVGRSVSQSVSAQAGEAVSHFLFTDFIVVIKCLNTLSHNDRILFNLFITAAPLNLIFKVQPGH